MPAVPKKSTPGKFAYIWHFWWIGINKSKFEKPPIPFKGDVITFSLPSPSSMPWPYENRELKQRRRRLRKRHLKSEVALLQTLSRLSHLVQFIKYWQFSLELNSKRLYQSSGKENESGSLVFTSSTKREIGIGIRTLRFCRSRWSRRRRCLSFLLGTLRNYTNFEGLLSRGLLVQRLLWNIYGILITSIKTDTRNFSTKYQQNVSKTRFSLYSKVHSTANFVKKTFLLTPGKSDYLILCAEWYL